MPFQLNYFGQEWSGILLHGIYILESSNSGERMERLESSFKNEGYLLNSLGEIVLDEANPFLRINMCITSLYSLLKSCVLILGSTIVLLLEIKSFSKYLTVFSRQVNIYSSNFSNKCCLSHCCFLVSDWLLCSYEKENLRHGWRIIWKTVWICGMLWPEDPAMDCYMSTKREKVKNLIWTL